MLLVILTITTGTHMPNFSHYERDWIQSTEVKRPTVIQDPGLEVTYDMAIASRGIEATELDTVPAELMDYFQQA
jgi:hypothetical protein